MLIYIHVLHISTEGVTKAYRWREVSGNHTYDLVDLGIQIRDHGIRWQQIFHRNTCV